MFSTAIKLRSVSGKVSKAASKANHNGSAKKADSDDSDVETGRAPKRPRGKGIKGRLPTVHRRLNKKRCAVTWLIVLFLGAVAGVLGYYFAFVKYAEYYEYGLLRDSTGRVDVTWVYWNEWVTRGPYWSMLKFPATAQHVVMRNVSVGTKDELGIMIDLTFQYYLRRWDVPDLHDAYRDNFSRPIVNRVLDTVKELTPQFDSRVFLTKRDEIEETLFLGVRWRLEGACCLRNCSMNQTRPCREDCIERESCGPEDMGTYVEVKHFYLLGVGFPEGLSERFLANVITNLTGQASDFRAQIVSERAMTNLMIADIVHEELRVNKTAEITANLTLSVAKSNYTSIVRGARAQALDRLCDMLNITSEKMKNSLEYNQILAEADSVHMNVDYQPLFVKERGP